MDKRRERAEMGSAKGKVLKVFIVVLVLLVVFWFLFVGIIANHATKTMTITVKSTEILKHWKWNGRERNSHYWDSHFIYVSKRRVPNGPDPIHNRYILFLL